MIGIYKITSPSNKVYIGQSVNINRRFNHYFKLQSCKNQIHLYNSLLKYGVENHKFDILLECTRQELDLYETFWYNFYKNMNFTLLNLKEPGSKGKHHPDSLLKIIEGLKKRKPTDYTKQKIRNSLKGHEVTNETREKISKSKLGKKLSDEHKEKISNAMKGKQNSLGRIPWNKGKSGCKSQDSKNNQI